MPELRSPHGYFFASGFTLVSTILMAICLNRAHALIAIVFSLIVGLALALARLAAENGDAVTVKSAAAEIPDGGIAEMR